MTGAPDLTIARGPARAEGPVVSFASVRFKWPGPRPFSLSVAQFQLAPGEKVLLLGPSGGGKSTFLSLLAGIVVPEAGRIEILGSDLAAMGGAARDRFRAEHFGVIFQMFNLLPYGSVLDNVMLPLRFAAGRRVKASAATGRAEDEARRLLEALGVDRAIVGEGSAASLSVGQQQRVAAARALIGRPEIMVADEPTSALDRSTQAAFLDLLARELASAGSSLVMVSHDESLSSRFDRVLKLEDIARVSRERPS